MARSNPFLISLGLWLLAAPGLWAEPPRVAVVGVSNYHHVPALANLHPALARDLEGALQQTGRFTVVAGESLAGLLAARQLTLADLWRDPQRTLAGKGALPLDYLVTACLQGDSVSTQATATFLHAAGPRAGECAHNFTAMGVTVPYVAYLAQDLAAAARAAFPLHGRVVTVRGGEALVNLGQRDGLRVDDELLVEELGAEQRDPGTGAVVFQERRLVGRLRVREVQASGARAEALETAPLEPGLAVSSAPAPAPAPADGRRLLTVAETAVVPPLEKGRGQWVQSLLTSELAARQKAVAVRVLEREHLQQVFAEMGLAETGLFDRTQAVRAGQLLAADLLVGTTVAQAGADFTVTARLVTAGSGESIQALTRSGPQLEAVVTALADGLADLLRPAELRALGQASLEGQVTFNYRIIPTGQYDCLPAVAPPLVEYVLRNRGEQPLRLRLTTALPGWAPDCARELLLAPGETRSLAQNPPLDSRGVAALADPVNAQVQCRVQLAGAGTVVLEDSALVQLLPRQAWLARLPVRRGVLPLMADQTLVAWVRDSQELAALRAEGARLGPMRRLYGYQPAFLEEEGWPTATAAQRRAAVRAQVEGLYQALLRRGLSYVEDARLSFQTDAGQRVWRPEEVLGGRRANCLDGAVLFAALLAPSFDPLLVLTDTHAFVGWRTWAGPEAGWDFLETTLLAAPGSTFEQALRQGEAAAARVGLTERLRQLETLEFDSTGLLTPPAPGVVVIDVRAAQRYLEARRDES